MGVDKLEDRSPDSRGQRQALSLGLLRSGIRFVQFEDAPGDRGRNRTQMRNRDFGSRNAGEAGEIGVAAIEEEIQRNKQGSQGSGKTIEGVQTDSRT